MPPTKKLFAYFILLLVPLIWSGSIFVSSDLKMDPAVNISLLRWLLVAIFLSPFAIKSVIKEWSILKKYWKRLTLFAFFGIVISPTFALEAVHHENLINAGLINGTTPIFILALTAISFHQKLSLSKCLGLLLGFIAVLLVITHGNFSSLAHTSFGVGDMLMLLSVLAWAVYSILLHYQPKGLSPISFLFVISCIGVLLLLPWNVWNLAHGIDVTLNHTSIESILYMSLLTSIAGYLGWNKGVSLIGAERAGFFLNFYPIFSMHLGALFFGQKIYWFDRLSLLLILIGLYLINQHHKTDAPDQA